MTDESIYYEDLDDDVVWVTASRTITETDVVSFAGLSGDYNRIHVDAAYASNTEFGGRIAHGLLVLSILSGLVTRTIFNQKLERNLIGLLNVQCKFPAPSFIGDTIIGEVRAIDKRLSSKGGRGVVTFSRQAINQHGDVVVDSEFTQLIGCRHGK